MEIWHFFAIFYDFIMKCVYESTIYTFVIRDKIWTPPLCCTKVYMLLLCFWSRKHPHHIHVRHFCVSPPPLQTPYNIHYTIRRTDAKNRKNVQLENNRNIVSSLSNILHILAVRVQGSITPKLGSSGD